VTPFDGVHPEEPREAQDKPKPLFRRSILSVLGVSKGRKPCSPSPLHRFATRAGERSRLGNRENLAGQGRVHVPALALSPIQNGCTQSAQARITGDRT
jgi:hypothetical protein